MACFCGGIPGKEVFSCVNDVEMRLDNFLNASSSSRYIKKVFGFVIFIMFICLYMLQSENIAQ